MIRLTEKKACCGCTACAAVCPRRCIRMVADAEGFLYPHVDRSRCVECGRCEEVCPCLHPGTPHEPQACYAAVHRNEAIRLASSSGGLFTALAEETLRCGGVVFGARFTPEFGVEHGYTETVEGLAAFRGSKYVQSNLHDSFRQAETFLKEGREVLFSGVACQIAGLKAFLRKEYEKLVTLDILCHGVASPAVWRSFLHPYLNRPEALQQLSFRDKQKGWTRYELSLHYAHETLRLPRKKNAYMTGYFANLYLRPACHACPRRDFSAGSDLTLGDCWGIEKQPPQPYCADNKGVSLVMVHTPKGSERMLRIGAHIHCTAIDYRPLADYNPAIHHRPSVSPKRERFFARWKQGEPFGQIVASLTRPSLRKRIEELCTPLLKALGIKGFTKRLRT